MGTRTAEAKVMDIIPTTAMPVTKGTQAWFEAIYAAGAVTFLEDGSFELNPRIREVVAAMHTILSGGEIEVTVKRAGDATFDALERIFDHAISETNTANRVRSELDDGVLPYVP